MTIKYIFPALTSQSYLKSNVHLTSLLNLLTGITIDRIQNRIFDVYSHHVIIVFLISEKIILS